MTMEKTYLFSKDDYILLGKSILKDTGVSSEHGDILMASLLDSDQKGIHTHGFYRLYTYIRQISRGNINPRPDIKRIRDSDNIVLMDGENGLGSVLSYYAMQEAIKISGKRGIGVVGMRRSSHFGTAAYYAEMAAERNQIGIVMTNASPGIAPSGGKKPVLGNNPWSISVPTHLGYPITLDIANSVVARGKIRLKALNNEPIPLGWALNKNGNPTTNATEALEGIILPIGDYKGYGITLMIDILSGILTGANFGDQVPGVEENGKRNNGHLFISLNAEAFMEIDDFKNRIHQLTHIIKSTPKVNQDVEILLPGEKEWKTKLNQENGTVRIPERIFEGISAMCKEYDLQMPECQSV